MNNIANMAKILRLHILREVLKNFFYGRKVFQKVFEKLFTISLAGMNYWNLADISKDGELYFLKYLKKKESDVIIFDVGANVGVYTRACCEVFGPRAEIHSFEPSQTAYGINKEMLQSRYNVVLNNFGLGSVLGNNEKLHCWRKGGSGSSIFKKQIPDSEYCYSEVEKIRLESLDKYCATNEITHITLLKIDVEGYEFEVLKGAKGFLDRKLIKYIQFEFGEGAIGAKLYFKDFYELLSPNYKIHRLVRDGWVPIDKYSINLEVFVTANYLAILRGQ